MRGELPQGAKSLHMGGIVLPLGDSMGKFGATLFWVEFGKIFVSGFYEAS
jgi:hypothetical protein